MPDSPPVAAPTPRRVRVLIDRFKESGGTILREDDSVLIIRTPEGVEKSFEKSLLLGVFPVLDAPEGTPVIIQFRDGRRVEAELIRDDFHQSQVRIHNIEVTLMRENFWALELAPSFEDLLAQLRAQIQPTNWAQRVQLARWMMQQNQPLAAKEELTEILRSYDAQEAHDLLSRAENLIRTQTNEAARNANKKTPPAGSTKPPMDQPGLPTLRLSPSDVNILKVFEVDCQRPPRMQATPGLAKKIIAHYATSDALPADPEARKAMDNWSADQLLKLLFTLKARDLYQEIQVETEPIALELFHRRVHNNWLIPNCSTSHCHGGVNARNFFMFATDYRNERTRYTNLLILLRSPKIPGKPPLIDFENPEQSLLIQCARPRVDAKFPHPDVSGWKPIFIPGRESLLNDALLWIRSMHQPHAEYPIDYNPPILQKAKEAGAENKPDR
ncbi:MAG: hypothetical protein EXS12_07020 [Phycisphaerales bacterium]|nr:hypothetical protein [Phycisphaerales bacterium]